MVNKMVVTEEKNSNMKNQDVKAIMERMDIQPHNYQKAKTQIKKYSKIKKEELELETVDIAGGFLGLGEHKVTGYELNERLEHIQKLIIQLNNKANDNIRMFGRVYEALEELDKDYIKAILINIEATRITSEGVANSQEEIRKLVNNQMGTLKILQEFKRKLDSYSHLGDIDKLWEDFQENYAHITGDIDKLWKEIQENYDHITGSIDSANETVRENVNKINRLEESIETIYNTLEDVNRSYEQQNTALQSVVAITTELEKIVHLKDADKMWDLLYEIQESLTSVNGEINSVKYSVSEMNSDIDVLLNFRERLSVYKHLEDVDEIWDKTELHAEKLDELSSQSNSALEIANANKNSIDDLIKCKEALLNENETQAGQLLNLEQKNEELSNLINNNKSLIDDNKNNLNENLETMDNKNQKTFQELNKKIKFAYWVAGGSLGLALVEFVLILLKVI